MPKRAGILALQGDYEAHAKMLKAIGSTPVLVRRSTDLKRLGMLVMPGGESTTMSMLLDTTGLREPLREAIASGLPTLATCAGIILLARELHGDRGSIEVNPLGLLDAAVTRNAYGRQVNSFEADLKIDWQALGLAGETGSFPGVFIRAPQITDPANGARIICVHRKRIVAVRQANLLAVAFHPELSGDSRLHQAVINFNN